MDLQDGPVRPTAFADECRIGARVLHQGAHLGIDIAFAIDAGSGVMAEQRLQRCPDASEFLGQTQQLDELPVHRHEPEIVVERHDGLIDAVQDVPQRGRFGGGRRHRHVRPSGAERAAASSLFGWSAGPRSGTLPKG